MRRALVLAACAALGMVGLELTLDRWMDHLDYSTRDLVDCFVITLKAPSYYLSLILDLDPESALGFVVDAVYYFALALGIVRLWQARRVKILAGGFVLLAVLHVAALPVLMIELGRTYQAWVERQNQKEPR